MIKNSLKYGFIGVSALFMTGCSDDNLNSNSQINEAGILSNEEITLLYGSDALSSNVSTRNSAIPFHRLTGGGNEVGYSTNSSNSYQQPDLTGAVQLLGTSWSNLADNTTYYIAEGDTFTGGVNFGNNVTLVVLGNIGSSNWFSVKNNAQVIIAPTAQISSVTGFTVENSVVDNYGEILSDDFNLNAGGILNNHGSIAEFQLNNNSGLNNYGTAVSSKAGINGTVNNYDNLKFTYSQVSLNNPGTINNECVLVFNGQVNINADITNNSYVDFQNGFLINSNGNVIVGSASLTDVTAGEITINGKIKNISGGNARLDIVNTTLGSLNATPAFEGILDINTDLEIPSNKVDNQVTFNGNTFVQENGCLPQRGLPACNDSELQFTLTATVQSPEVNGAVLSATDVKVVDGFAYVSYHTNDEVYGDVPNGAIRIFNVQSHNNPVLVNEAQFNNAEFNGVDVNDGTLYAVGGNKAGARLVTSPLTDGAFNTEDLSVFETYKLQSAAGKNSFVYNNMLWLVSGATNGGFFKLDKNNDFEVSEHLYSEGANAKYVTQNGTHQAFFAVRANGAYLRIANVDGSDATEYNYPSLVQTVTNGKNVIAMDNEYVYISLSDKGVAKIRIQDGELVNHFEPNQYRISEDSPKVFGNNGYTNGLALNDCYLYLANGADGVIVLNKNSFQVVGHFSLSDSANYVYAQNGLLFVATGRNGLNIIQIN